MFGNYCIECGKEISYKNSFSSGNHQVCKDCFIKLEGGETSNETEKQEMPENDGGGFFAPEKKGIEKGVSGGIIMMAIAAIWFGLGYKAGYIFFYPPILFLIGVFAFLKGLITMNFAGEADQAGDAGQIEEADREVHQV